MLICACSCMAADTATSKLRPISTLFRALGDETRLRIVALLTHGELCVCHIEAALELSQPNASRHVGLLRTAGIVEPRRERNWVYYRLAPQEDPERRQILKLLMTSFTAAETFKAAADRAKRATGPNPCG